MKRHFVLSAMFLLLCLTFTNQQIVNGQREFGNKHDNPAPVISPSKLTHIDLTRIAGGDKANSLDISNSPDIGSQFSVGPDFRIANLSTFENAAQVIAPNTKRHCPNGKVVLSSGEVSVHIRDLFDSTGKIDRNAQPVLSTGLSKPSDGEMGTDHVLVKLKDNSLLMLRNSLVWEEPTSPKPKWWSKYRLHDKAHGARVGTDVLRSRNCGATWNLISRIDPLKFDEGKYAVPRPLLNAFGGWDRVEAYVDPWNGNIYVSMNAAAGVADEEGNVITLKDSEGRDVDQTIGSHFLFRSTDGGKTWTKIHEFGAWTPIVVTSTPNGRLFLYTQMHAQPTLIYSLPSKRGMKFSQPKAIYYHLFNDPKIRIEGGTNPVFSCSVYKATNSISRASLDKTTSKVRLSYPIVNGFGQTGVAVVQVTVLDDTSEPQVKPLALLFGQDMTKISILSSNFIDPDIDGTVKGKSTKSILYWVEAKTTSPANPAPDDTPCSPPATVTANYVVFDSEAAIGAPKSQFLSRDISNKGRSLTVPSLKHDFYGHYSYGGSFFFKGKLHYLGQWREADGVNANIVTLNP